MTYVDKCYVIVYNTSNYYFLCLHMAKADPRINLQILENLTKKAEKQKFTSSEDDEENEDHFLRAEKRQVKMRIDRLEGPNKARLE